MRLYGHHLHGNADPWNGASAREIETLCMLRLILENQETMMSDMTKLNQVIEDLKAEVADIGTKMDANFAALNAAHAAGDQAAIDAATASIQESVDALKAIGTRDTPAG